VSDMRLPGLQSFFPVSFFREGGICSCGSAVPLFFALARLKGFGGSKGLSLPFLPFTGVHFPCFVRPGPSYGPLGFTRTVYSGETASLFCCSNLFGAGFFSTWVGGGSSGLNTDWLSNEKFFSPFSWVFPARLVLLVTSVHTVDVGRRGLSGEPLKVFSPGVYSFDGGRSTPEISSRPIRRSACNRCPSFPIPWIGFFTEGSPNGESKAPLRLQKPHIYLSFFPSSRPSP